MSERAFKILWSLLATISGVQTSFASFVVTLSSYPTGSDTHKALVDRAKSPDAFWHHRIRVLHHLWNKNNEPLRFCFIVKRKQYKRGDLHRCHNTENKWHRLYLAQDSLCLFFSCHEPKVHGGSCQLPLPTQRGGSAVGWNPTVPGITPAEWEDGSHLHVLPNHWAALLSLSSHHTASSTAHPQHLLARNLKNWASFWNKYSPSFHVWTYRKGKWLKWVTEQVSASRESWQLFLHLLTTKCPRERLDWEKQVMRVTR